MRSEKEMFELIINIARQDERIRSVYMNGSRSNPNVPKDIFQDYDIVYVVTETKSFREDESWIDGFGQRLYMQMPEKMDFLRGKAYDFDNVFGWLIQFADGNRLDLHIVSMQYAVNIIKDDQLCVVLLDKDGILPSMQPSTDVDYHVKKPLENDYLCDCNNFWWCLNNVAKGLWRDEVPYVMDMINEHIRPLLVNMLAWKIGYETDYSCSVGKSGKYMKKYLDYSVWQRFLTTYTSGKVEAIWEGTFIMCDLFDEIAKDVADKQGFSYNEQEALASRSYLEHVRNLPKDATEVY